MSVQSLAVGLDSGDGGVVHAVRDVSFDLMPGETLGLVGESGSGKSTLALALTRLAARSANARIGGRVVFEGRDLLASSEEELHRVRGGRIGYVFQSPDAALNPTQTIGSQVGSVLRVHRSLSAREANAEAIDLLDRVGIRDPSVAARRYPHQFSGGMKQRAVIAIALANRPSLLIADEPTTALDVLVQDHILTLLASIRESGKMAMILVSHDLRVVARLADRILVLDAGRVAEIGPTRSVLETPQHRYTAGLIAAVPKIVTVRQNGLLPTIPGQPSMDAAVSVGCPFAPRCDYATDICRSQLPNLEYRPSVPLHEYACWHPVEDHV